MDPLEKYPECAKAGLAVDFHAQYGGTSYGAWVNADDVEALLKVKLGPDIGDDLAVVMEALIE